MEWWLKYLMGLIFSEYLREIRLNMVCIVLENGDVDFVEKVVVVVGFKLYVYFSWFFCDCFGKFFLDYLV